MILWCCVVAAPRARADDPNPAPGAPASAPASLPASAGPETAPGSASAPVLSVTVGAGPLPAHVIAEIPDEILASLRRAASEAGPRPLVSVTLGTALIDDPAALDSALAPDLPRGEPLREDKIERLAYRLWRLHYIPTPAVFPEAGGVRLELNLAPAVAVRKVRIRYTAHPWLAYYVASPLFEQDVLAHVPLHPGSILPSGVALGETIETTEDSLLRYLHDRGYWDARVSVEVQRGARSDEADLQIDISGVWLWGRRYTVGAIKVTGNSAVSTAEFIDVLGTSRWASLFSGYSRDALRDGIDRLVALYHQRGYPYARIELAPGSPTPDPESKRVDLSLVVREGRRVDVHFFVDGAETDATRELLDAITIFTSGSADEYALESSADQLVHDFQTHGFFTARVTFDRESPAGPQGVLVVDFRIARGPELKVQGIEFRGNHAFSSEDLAGRINEQPFPPFWGRLGLGSNYYATSDSIAGDIKILAETYRNAGYPSARIVASAAPDPRLLGVPGAVAAVTAAGRAGGALYLRFDIDEGMRILVGTVSFAGNRSVPSETLGHLLQYQVPGDPFVESLLLDRTKDTGALADYYAAHGFPLVDIHVDAQPDADPTREDIVYTIHEGPHASMGRLFVRGNFLTREHVITRDFPLHTGDSFDQEAVSNYRQHLLGLGDPVSRRTPRLFRSVDVAPVGYDETPVDLVVDVVELYDPPSSIDAEIGYSTDECLDNTFSLDCLYNSLAYTNANLLGTGWRLHIQGTTGLLFWGEALQGHPIRGIDQSLLSAASADLIDPRILDSYVQGALTTFARREQTIRLGLVTTLGVRLTLSERLTDDLTLSGFYDAENINHPEDATRPGGPFEGQSQVIVPTKVGSLTAGLIYDRRRVFVSDESVRDYLRKLAPDAGWYLQLQGTYTNPFLYPFSSGGSDFAILHLQGGYWLPLPGAFRLGAGFEYDHGFPLDGALLPKAEQFFAGGESTMRGYVQDEFKRQIIQYPIPGAPGVYAYRVIPEGGNIRGLAHVELMHPLGGGWSTVGFTDLGYIVDSYSAFSLGDIGESVGLGLRYSLPAGFASIEYGIPVPDLVSGGVPLGDQRAPTCWEIAPCTLVPGRFHLNFDYIY